MPSLSIPSTDQDLLTLSRTIYGEARGEYNHPLGGLSALIGVANVIMNRTQQGSRFGHSIHEVCTRPYQFSCWNFSDPNRSLIASKTKGSESLFDLCFHVATEVSQGHWPDLTKGSDHYHAPLKNLPNWTKNQKPRVVLGQHTFYKIS